MHCAGPWGDLAKDDNYPAPISINFLFPGGTLEKFGDQIFLTGGGKGQGLTVCAQSSRCTVAGGVWYLAWEKKLVTQKESHTHCHLQTAVLKNYKRWIRALALIERSGN